MSMYKLCSNCMCCMIICGKLGSFHSSSKPCAGSLFYFKYFFSVLFNFLHFKYLKHLGQKNPIKLESKVKATNIFLYFKIQLNL